MPFAFILATIFSGKLLLGLGAPLETPLSVVSVQPGGDQGGE